MKEIGILSLSFSLQERHLPGFCDFWLDMDIWAREFTFSHVPYSIEQTKP